ncbi:MAG: PDDEXK nuclease domain-containing protein [Bacteroidetes bacterium]|nr:PDDEXK nuclease domain-containing protein [Bacteroidota bacterium]MCL6103380.1 PDDEXK nuclease domain-containing protein [Bacteroidota bacterium]
MDHPEKSASLLALVKEVIENARSQVFRNTNSIALKMYWQIGRLIVEDEQQGKAKAVYGQKVLKQLSLQLTLEFGKGFEERNLNNMRAFYLAFPIWNAVRTELSWTHYRLISRVENEQQRMQYIAHAVEGNWDTRSLERNIRTQYIGRLLEPHNEIELKPQHLLKDPYILEFLGIPQDVTVTENKIETAIINHLQKFLMELGKGFAFVARQQHIVTDSSDFFIDLVFYNYFLKCFVLIDLKTGKLTHEAIGQMDMYVRMYNDLKKREDDNPTLGIILCTEKDETIVKYSVLSENEKLFASKYRLYLPKEEELKQLIDADRIKFDLDHE